MIETNWQDIPSMVNDYQVEKEYLELDRQCKEIYRNIGTGWCIEVGCFHGKSTALLAQYFKVLAIDTWGLGWEQGATGRMSNYSDFGGDAFKEFLKNMIDRKLIHWDGEEESVDRVHPVCSTSKVLDSLPYLEANFAFVDAEHTYPAAYKDLVRCARQLREGGVLSLHDIARPGWGWGDLSRDEVDPWHGNFLSMNKFMEKHYSIFRIKEHCEGIMFFEKE